MSLIKRLVTSPFKKQAEGDMTTLRGLGPSREETSIIDESVDLKYGPVLRDSFIGSLAAAPGLAMMPQAQAVLTALGLVMGVTGVAWFAMSLKDVKLKFSDFGVELTSNMMAAFFTSFYLILISAGQAGFAEEIQKIQEWAKEAGIDINQTLSENPWISTLAKLITSGVVLRLIVENVRAAVVKFDANDALLTGAGATAVEAFEKQLDSVREAGKDLDRTQELKTANMKIAAGLLEMRELLLDINVELIPSGLESEQMLDCIMLSMEDFDGRVIPIFQQILRYFEGFDLSDSFRGELRFVLGTLEILESREGVEQEFGDTVYGKAFVLISRLIKSYSDDLAELEVLKN